ncbi:MAG: hypothetical protein R3F61_12645 [Myxococcota bacterium]
MIAIVLGLFACSDSGLWSGTGDNPPLEDTSSFDGDDTGDFGGSGDSGGFGDTGEGAEGPWVGQWGEVQDGVEAYTGFVDWDGTTARCEVEYELTGGSDVQGCPSCTVARSYTYGPAQVVTNVGGRCGQLGWDGLQGSTLTVGHAPPESLMRLDGGTWQSVGWSDVTGTTWGFEIELSP